MGRTSWGSNYNDLWNVEAAFRVTKHDLKVRPVFHWKPRRIIAHIAICFTAYATSILFDKEKRIRYGLPSKMKKDARKIYNILDINRSITPYIIEKCKM